MMLIIVGTGHSGTRFVATLFQIRHEPQEREDAQVYVKAFYDREFSKQYIKKYFLGLERECNSFLVPHAEAIRELFPEATMFHLVRDPRKVVRSLMSNDLYSGDNIDYHNVKLFDNGWDDLTQFEKTCWYWRIINERLRKLELPVIRLEDLRGQPDHAKAHKFPSWEEWTDEQKEQFNQIIYPEVKYYGYDAI